MRTPFSDFFPYHCKTVICFAVVLLMLSSCSSVKPWQRDYLAKPSMQWGATPMADSLQKHIYFSKEASSGGNAAGGGGCGCN